MTHLRSASLTVLAVALGLAVAACGDDDDTSCSCTCVCDGKETSMKTASDAECKKACEEGCPMGSWSSGSNCPK